MRLTCSFLALILFAIGGGNVFGKLTFDQGCYENFPVLDGLLCYVNCKAGYANYGGGPVCWANCPPRTMNIGVSCQKDSYGRGAGEPLSACRAGEEKDGALCYPQCRSGYYGIGPVCWEHCQPGWQDQGTLCGISMHVYSRDTSSCPWYNKCGLFGANCGAKCRPGYVNDGCTCRRPPDVVAKKTYGRGAGKPMICATNQEQSGALCYPYCNTGFYGVGPVCWATCSGETKDVGALCQKNTYGRGVGKPLACLTMLTATYAKEQEIHELSDYMEGVTSKTLTRAVCLGIWAASKNLIKALSFIGSCSKQNSWNTILFSISGSASALLTAGVEIGLAYDVKTNQAACYLEHCTGFNLDVSIGIAVNVGWFRSLSDIPGISRSISFGLEVPGTEIGFTIASVSNPQGEGIGSITSIGLGVGISPLPFDVGGATCNTPEDQMITFTPEQIER